jgi:hypothetical protein
MCAGKNLQMVLANYRKSENAIFQHAVRATSLKRLVSSSVSLSATIRIKGENRHSAK